MATKITKESPYAGVKYSKQCFKCKTEFTYEFLDIMHDTDGYTDWFQVRCPYCQTLLLTEHPNKDMVTT